MAPHRTQKESASAARPRLRRLVVVFRRAARSLMLSKLVALVLLTLGYFVVVVAQQGSAFNVRARIDALAEAKEILPLGAFEAQFQRCEWEGEAQEAGALRECAMVGEPASLTFPDASATARLLKTLPSEPTHVVLRRTLTAEERAFVAAQGDVSLVFPRNVHFETRLGPTRSLGVGSQSTFALSQQELLAAKGELRFEMEIAGLDRFGPAELPVALVSQGATAEYQALLPGQVAASSLGRQLQFAIPLILACMALFLDHSATFRLLALFAAVRATRSFFSHLCDTADLASRMPSVLGVPSAHALLGALNGLALAALLALVLDLSDASPRVRRYRWSAYAALLLAFTGWGAFDVRAWLRGDLVADALGGFLACAFVVRALIRTSSKDDTPRKGTRESTAQLRARRTERVAAFSTHAMALLVFGMLGVANASELLTDASALRTVADWRYALFYPGVCLVAFFHVGGSSRLIRVQASELARQRIQDRELAEARTFQRRLLPQRRATTEAFEWRSWYVPASELAGDWFDVREIEFVNGEKKLVAIVADVTGHGTGAALTTVIISAFWSQWAKECELSLPPATKDERSAFLADAASRVNHGLGTSRERGTCTAVLALADPVAEGGGVVTLCSCAHPAPLMKRASGISTLLSGAGSLLGRDDDATWRTKEFPFEEGEVLCLYSDGIFPLDEDVSSWTLHLKKEFARLGRSPLVERLVRQVRITRADYRRDRTLEDDITLLAIRRLAVPAASREPAAFTVSEEGAATA